LSRWNAATVRGRSSASAAWSRLSSRRSASRANALNQGVAADANAAGERRVYDRLPYFFSDQYDLGLEYVCHHAPDDDVIIRGHLEAREFIAFWHRDGIVTGAMNVNVWDVVDDLKAIVAGTERVDLRRVADPDVGLAEASSAGAA
jgi:hypothetical protein